MRFITVDQNGKHTGINIVRLERQGEVSYWVLLGGEGEVGVPVSKMLVPVLEEWRTDPTSTIERTVPGKEPVVFHPHTWFEERRDGSTQVCMFAGDLGLREKDNTLLIRSEPQRSEHKREPESCLVLLHVPDGATLTQISYDERVVDGRVVYQYHPFVDEYLGELPGIEVVLRQGNQWLLKLLPNAGLRIEKGPQTMVIKWSGFPDRIDYKTQTVDVNAGLDIKIHGRAERTGRRSQAG